MEIPSDSIEDAYILPHTHNVYKSAMDLNDSFNFMLYVKSCFNFILQDNDQFMMMDEDVADHSAEQMDESSGGEPPLPDDRANFWLSDLAK